MTDGEMSNNAVENTRKLLTQGEYMLQYTHTVLYLTF